MLMMIIHDSYTLLAITMITTNTYNTLSYDNSPFDNL